MIYRLVIEDHLVGSSDDNNYITNSKYLPIKEPNAHFKVQKC